MNNQAYELNEIARFNRELIEIEKQSLQDRKENRDHFVEILNNHLDLFFTRIEWLLNGSYGAGSLFAFNQLTKRMNRKAWLFNTIARIEWRTSLKYSCEIWNNLDTDLQLAINAKLDQLIKDHDLDRE